MNCVQELIKFTYMYAFITHSEFIMIFKYGITNWCVDRY